MDLRDSTVNRTVVHWQCHRDWQTGSASVTVVTPVLNQLWLERLESVRQAQQRGKDIALAAASVPPVALPVAAPSSQRTQHLQLELAHMTYDINSHVPLPPQY